MPNGAGTGFSSSAQWPSVLACSYVAGRCAHPRTWTLGSQSSEFFCHDEAQQDITGTFLALARAVAVFPARVIRPHPAESGPLGSRVEGEV
jgi:hypothetical protein